MKAQTLEWWTFEDNPLTSWINGGQPAVLEQTYDAMGADDVGISPAGEEALPEDVAARLLRLVRDDFDAGSCEVNGCGVDPVRNMSGPRPNTVGFALHGDADEDTRWHMTTIVRIADGRLVLACEECNPETMYELMAPDPEGDPTRLAAGDGSANNYFVNTQAHALGVRD